MSDDNDTDRLLGKLIEKAEESTRQQTAMFGKLDRLAESQAAMMGALQLHAADDKASMGAMNKRLDAIEPAVEDYKKNRQRGIGMLLGLTAGGGTAGAGIVAALSKLFGGNGP